MYRRGVVAEKGHMSPLIYIAHVLHNQIEEEEASTLQI
jgi:hypothetical protein